MHLENYWTYAACTLPVQRKEINVVKARFTMRCSSKKLSHEKVIITASNFEDKLLVLSRLNLLLGIKKNLKSRHFFKPSQGIWAKSLRLLITFFRPETKYRCKIRTRIIIYLQSNWAREFIYFLFISLVFFFEKGEHTDKLKVKKPRTTHEKKRKRENVLYFLAELYLSFEHVNNSAYCRQPILIIISLHIQNISRDLKEGLWTFLRFCDTAISSCRKKMRTWQSRNAIWHMINTPFLTL